MSRKHIRADKLLVERGQAKSGSEARALILAGRVFRDDRRIEKAGMEIPAFAVLEVRGKAHPWVSRGGIKLAHALDVFGIDPAGAVAVDVGASTGGFTDVLLTRGARWVYAVDVGYGQLAWNLRQDPRVQVLDRTNARHLGSSEVPRSVDLVTCDASFIGLAKVLPASLALVRPGGKVIALIKPQFEAGREDVGKGGVVRDAVVRDRVCREIEKWFAKTLGWRVIGTTESPIQGAAGNVESLIAAERPASVED